MSSRSRQVRAVLPSRFDALRAAFLKSVLVSAVAITVGVTARFAGTSVLSAGTAILVAALGGGAYVVYAVLATRSHGRGIAMAVVAAVSATAAVPALRTLWPGAPIRTAMLRAPGDELALAWPHARAAWVLVASNVSHDRPAWWAEYELRVGDASLIGNLGRLPGKRLDTGGVPVRAPGNELRARYHRLHLDQPIAAVRLVRIAGEVPGGLAVSVLREPIASWLAFAGWAVVLLAVTVIDGRGGYRGALALAATIPVVISMVTWRYVTPAAPLDGVVRAVLGGTFVGTFVGCGGATITAMVLRRLRSRR